MPEATPTRPARSRDSMSNILFVAVGVSLVCSVLVASAALILKPQQVKNADRYRQRIILEVAGLYEPGADIDKLFSTIEAQKIKLESGDEATVYVVRKDGAIDEVILPIEGSGLWSTMYGYLAVESDGNTVRGLRFYEHGETPGLGAQVDDPKWRALWRGKKLYDERHKPAIRIIKGVAPKGSEHEIDGLAGATLTGLGVTNFVRYWIGDEGYGPYLRSLQQRNRSKS